MKTIKVNIKDIKEKYPSSSYPVLDYCKYLISIGEEPKSRLEAWNYEREIPAWDWAVNNMENYVKTERKSKKKEVRKS